MRTLVRRSRTTALRRALPGAPVVLGALALGVAGASATEAGKPPLIGNYVGRFSGQPATYRTVFMKVYSPVVFSSTSRPALPAVCARDGLDAAKLALLPDRLPLHQVPRQPEDRSGRDLRVRLEEDAGRRRPRVVHGVAQRQLRGKRGPQACARVGLWTPLSTNATATVHSSRGCSATD